MDEKTVEVPTDQIQLIDLLKAMSDPVRLRLLAVMRDGEFHSCRAQIQELGLHKSTLSHHFKVMRQAGLTSTRIVGRRRETRLRKDDLDRRFPGLIDSLVANVGR